MLYETNVPKGSEAGHKLTLVIDKILFIISRLVQHPVVFNVHHKRLLFPAQLRFSGSVSINEKWLAQVVTRYPNMIRSYTVWVSV